MKEQLVAAANTNQSQSTNIERLNTGIAKLKPYREQFNNAQLEIASLKEKHAAEIEQQRAEHKLHEEVLMSQLKSRIIRLEKDLTTQTATSSKPEESAKKRVVESEATLILSKKLKEADEEEDVEIELHSDDADAELYETFDTEGEFYTHGSYEEGHTSVDDEDDHDYHEDKSPTTETKHPIITEYKGREINHPLEFITDMPALEMITTEESDHQSASETEPSSPRSPGQPPSLSHLSPHAPPFVASGNTLDQENGEDGEVIIPSATTLSKPPPQTKNEEEPIVSVPAKGRMADLSKVSERSLPMEEKRFPRKPAGRGVQKTRRGASSSRRHTRHQPEDHQ